MFTISKPIKESYITGFSLIELMIVLIIIGFLSSVVVLSIGDNFNRELRNEAERLQKIIIAGSEEAIFSTSELAVDLDSDGYSLVKLDPLSGSWIPFNIQSLNYYKLPESIEIIWNIEGFTDPGSDKSISQDDTVEFFIEDVIQEQDYEDTTYYSKQTSITPDILLISSGEVSVFEIFFIARDVEYNKSIIRLKSDGFSVPLVEYVDEANQSDYFFKKTY